MPRLAVTSSPSKPIFELAEMAKVVGMPLTKAKNWTMGRPIRFQASLRAGMGTGSRNLYSLDDVYLMALAYECSKTGMAAKAIGKLVEAVKARFPNGLGAVGTVYVTRDSKLKYHVEARQDQLPADVVVRLDIDVRRLCARIDREVAKLR